MKAKPETIKKKIQVRYLRQHYFDIYVREIIEKNWPCYISKCPYCGYTCEVQEWQPSLQLGVCSHFDHTEGKLEYAIFKATGKTGQ